MAKRQIATLAVGIIAFSVLMALSDTIADVRLRVGIATLAGACFGIVMVYVTRRRNRSK